MLRTVAAADALAEVANEALPGGVERLLLVDPHAQAGGARVYPPALAPSVLMIAEFAVVFEVCEGAIVQLEAVSGVNLSAAGEAARCFADAEAARLHSLLGACAGQPTTRSDTLATYRDCDGRSGAEPSLSWQL